MIADRRPNGGAVITQSSLGGIRPPQHTTFNEALQLQPRNLVGRIDELAVFNRALSDAEARALVSSP